MGCICLCVLVILSNDRTCDFKGPCPMIYPASRLTCTVLGNGTVLDHSGSLVVKHTTSSICCIRENDTRDEVQGTASADDIDGSTVGTRHFSIRQF